MTNTVNEIRTSEIYRKAQALNIPDVEIDEAMQKITDIVVDNLRPGDDLISCIFTIAIAAYHTGKHDN